MEKRGNVSKKKLEMILKGLKVMIEPEWLGWLKGHDCYWEECVVPDSSGDDKAIYEITCRIQEILDSKVGEVRDHSFGFLSRVDVLEIAAIFNIQVPGRVNKRLMINMILEKIRAMCKKCKGTGEVGIANSTEGPKPIFCLDCRGTGKIR